MIPFVAPSKTSEVWGRTIFNISVQIETKNLDTFSNPFRAVRLLAILPHGFLLFAWETGGQQLVWQGTHHPRDHTRTQTGRPLHACRTRENGLGGSGEAMPLIPETDHIKHVTLTTTRLLSPLQNGKKGALGFANSFAGWDTGNEINYSSFSGSGAFQAVNDGSSFAQRYVMGSTSANRIRVDFGAYVDSTSFSAGSQLKATIYTDTTKAGAGPIPASANWGLFVGPGLYALGGLILGAFGVSSPKLERPASNGVSVIVPFGQLDTSNPVGGPTPLNSSIEFELTTPIIPAQAFWIAFSTVSSGSVNVQMLCSNQGNPNQPCATQAPNSGWTSNSAPGGPTAGQLASNVLPQLALSSSGATGYGNGNILTVWDSLGQGNAFQARSVLGSDQSVSQVDITTSFIAQQGRIGKIDVWFPASAGTSNGFSFLNNFSRWDYTAIITFEDF